MFPKEIKALIGLSGGLLTLLFIIKSSGNIFVPEGDNCAEAVSALMVLGFSQEEVAAAVSKIDTSLDTGEIVKQALKIIGKK